MSIFGNFVIIFLLALRLIYWGVSADKKADGK